MIAIPGLPGLPGLPIPLPAWALKWLAACGLLLAAFASGWWQGNSHAKDRAERDMAGVLAAAHERYRAAVVEGEQRSEHVLRKVAELSATASALQEKLNADERDHVPLVVYRTQACNRVAAAAAPVLAARGAAPGAAPGTTEPAAPAATATAEAGAAPGGDVDDAPRLTLGAVGVWNSALAGRHLPAGACGAADAPAGACAAESAFSIADAWRNHVANATSCAADRARFAALIEHVKARRP